MNKTYPISFACLEETRIRTVPNTQTLEDGDNSQCNGSGLVTALVVCSTCSGQQTYKYPGNALFVYIVDTEHGPFVIQDTYSMSAVPDGVQREYSPMMRKKPLPSYHPIRTAARSASGRVFSEGCLNCSRPLDYRGSQYCGRAMWEVISVERTVWPKASTPCATAAARSRG